MISSLDILLNKILKAKYNFRNGKMINLFCLLIIPGLPDIFVIVLFLKIKTLELK